MTGRLDDRAIARRLRAALGLADHAGACPECGDVGMVPDRAVAPDLPEGMGIWRPCPTCRGRRAVSLH